MCEVIPPTFDGFLRRGMSIEDGAIGVVEGVAAVVGGSKNATVCNKSDYIVRFMISEDPQSPVAKSTKFDAGIDAGIPGAKVNIGGRRQYEACGSREPQIFDVHPGHESSFQMVSSTIFIRAGFWKEGHVQVFWAPRSFDWQPRLTIRVMPHHDQPSNNVFEDIYPDSQLVSNGSGVAPVIGGQSPSLMPEEVPRKCQASQVQTPRGKSQGKTPRGKSPHGKSAQCKTPRGKSPHGKSPALAQNPVAPCRMPTMDNLLETLGFSRKSSRGAMGPTAMSPYEMLSAFGVGKAVKVYSDSCGGWVPATIHQAHADGSVSVKYSKDGLELFKRIPFAEQASGEVVKPA